MKYLLSILLLVFTISFSSAQNFNKDSLTGSWSVIHVTESNDNLPDEIKPMIEKMKTGFMNSKFNFKSDSTFAITFQKVTPFTNDLKKVLNNKEWKYNDNKKLISIGLKYNNYNNMRMYVKKTERKSIFYI
ncbi:DUF5004 domain-containing protein [Sporocytophaga myxococcoides]|uniref:DUF5004 domain-containing protein n=1 Tax=Sporocytophaga myxococcoides TaxID=153721 RepID=UPI000491DF97|nr:DUF5004 domain-containing protein [Sporocytophaga myxococcoides]